MTLFEATIHKLNIPRCVMDDIVAIRNICMEAEQQQPVNQPQNATQAQPQKNVKQQPANQKQNATQAQPQQNAKQHSDSQQQDATQAQPQQNAKQQAGAQQTAEEVSQNIEENQVDVNKLMTAFNNYLSGCQQKFTKMLTSNFGQDAQTAIDNVKSYVASNSQIDFNTEVAPFLTVNGNPISDPKVIDGIRKNFAKYFGANFVSSKPKEKKQEQPKQSGQPQEHTSA